MDGESFWQKITVNPKNYPSVEKDFAVDVLIIGGGITGITLAHQLMDSGKTVAVIEAFRIGGLTTSLTTGNLYLAVQPWYQTIAAKSGLAIAREVADSRQMAINFIEFLIRQQQIDCHFSRRPWFAFTNENKKTEMLEKEFEIFQKININAQFVEKIPYDLPFKKALFIPEQARFNALQYVCKVAENLSEKGCLLYEKTRAIAIEEDKENVLIFTESAKIKAKTMVMATHAPIGISGTQLFIAPYRSYAMAASLADQNYPEGHFWDLDKSFALSTHGYETVKPGILLIAGSHHKTGQDADSLHRFKLLEGYLKTHFNVEKIPYHWSAQHYQSADSIPYIGFASTRTKRIYMATGYFADGLVYGTVAAIRLADLILKKDKPQWQIYASDRLNLKASLPFLLKENENVLRQYLQDLPLKEEKDLESIKIGEGKVVELNQEKWAISRDENNELHKVSAVCTHMKCIVNWNNAEKTWDCPCHGSRFSQKGIVIEGPAVKNLCPFNKKEK